MFTSKNQPANDKTQTDHAMTTAKFGGHGHVVGKQGPDGHPMPPSDAHKQAGANIPQNVQNQSSDGAGSADADEPDGDDYGKVVKSKNEND